MGIETIAIAGVMAGASMYSTNQTARANNRSQRITQEEANRRYLFQESIMKDQIEEQDNMALSQMTDLSREFLIAKGKMETTQAESGVSGKSVDRASVILSNKEAEAKSKLATEIDTNKINIARDMMANKIDTEAIIRESKARELSSTQILTNTLISGVQGGASGYILGKSLFGSSGGLNTKATTGSSNAWWVKPTQ